jgi:hypothetical protein
MNGSSAVCATIGLILVNGQEDRLDMGPLADRQRISAHAEGQKLSGVGPVSGTSKMSSKAKASLARCFCR